MNKAIEINVLRVSPRGECLEFIINCPREYRFTKFVILVNGSEDKYDISSGLFYTPDGCPVSKRLFVGQVPLELLGVTEPSIFKVHLEAKRSSCTWVLPEGYSDDYYYVLDNYVMSKTTNARVIANFDDAVVKNCHWSELDLCFYIKVLGGGYNPYNPYNPYSPYTPSLPVYVRVADETAKDYIVFPEYGNFVVFMKSKIEYVQAIEDCGDDTFEDLLEADAYVSDVSNVYHCLIKDIIQNKGCCLDEHVLNNVILKYLVLYAHLESLRLGHIDDAEMWFKLLQSCNSKCKSGVSYTKYNYNSVNTNCNCSR